MVAGAALLVVFPVGLLGVLLLFACVELAVVTRDMSSKAEAFVMLLCAVVSLVGSSARAGIPLRHGRARPAHTWGKNGVSRMIENPIRVTTPGHRKGKRKTFYIKGLKSFHGMQLRTLFSLNTVVAAVGCHMR
jgi:hypothetical protein